MWVVIYAFPFCHLEREKMSKGTTTLYYLLSPVCYIDFSDFSGKLNKAQSAKLKLESGMNL